MKYTVLVTGSSRGIGKAIATKFAVNGHRVVFHCNQNVKMTEQYCKEMQDAGYSVMSVSGDIASLSDIKNMFDNIRKHFGHVDILINNAGIALQQKLLTDCSSDEIDQVLDVNLKGAMLCSREAIPEMVSKKHGSILFVSSYFGLIGGSCEAPYSASKAGMIGLMKSLAKELAPSGIRVNAVAPGFIQTDMNAHFTKKELALIKEDIPMERFGTVDDVANAVYFLALDEVSGFVTGQTLAVDGGCSI